jgi:hypothetical protein
MLRKKSLGVLILVSTSVAAQASTMTFTGTDLGGNATIGGTHFTGGVFAGLLDFNETSLGNIKTFCVDLDHIISNGQVWADSVSGSSLNATNGLKLDGNLVAADYSKATTNDKAEALQLDIWEARYDGGSGAGPDFSHGAFTVSGLSNSVLTAANTFWADVNKPGNATFIKEGNGYGQDQMFASPVPEPSSIAALCIGGIAILRRRKAKKA